MQQLGVTFFNRQKKRTHREASPPSPNAPAPFPPAPVLLSAIEDVGVVAPAPPPAAAAAAIDAKSWDPLAGAAFNADAETEGIVETIIRSLLDIGATDVAAWR